MASNEDYLDELLKSVVDEEDTSGIDSSDLELEPQEIDIADIDALLESFIENRDDTNVSESLSKSGENKEDSVVEIDVSEFSEDDIDQILERNRAEAAKKDNNVDELDDLVALLEKESNNDFSEINDMLEKSDNHILIDDHIDEETLAEGEPVDSGLSKKEQKAAERKRKKEEKQAAKLAAKQKSRDRKKDKKIDSDNNLYNKIEEVDASINGNEQSEMDALLESIQEESSQEADVSSEVEALSDKVLTKEKKKTFLTKIVDFLTEEDDDLESMKLSEENTTIIKEMNKEKEKSAKKENKKKPVKKKEAKPQKEKKPKKPKKEKKPKSEPEETITKEKKLSQKGIIIISAIGITIAASLLIMINLASDYSDKSVARDAFEEKDFVECYMNLYGKKMNETEEAMYYKSECILQASMPYKQYMVLLSSDKKVEALDELIQFVDFYPELYDHALTWNAVNEVQEEYQKILSILGETYFLSESQVLAIAREADDTVYTRQLMDIVNGNRTRSEGMSTEAPKENLLPEEEELIDDATFVGGSL